MHILKLSLLCSAAIIMSACGGGGGKTNPPKAASSSSMMSSIASTPSSLASSATSTSSTAVSSTAISSVTSVSSVNSSSAPVVQVSLSQSNIYFSADIGDSDSVPSSTSVTVTLTNAPEPTYIMSTGFAPFVEPASSVALVENGQATIDFKGVMPSRLRPGTQVEKIYVRACKDQACLEEYPGTMKIITAQYEVLAPTFTTTDKKVTFDLDENGAGVTTKKVMFESDRTSNQNNFVIYTFNSNGIPDWLNVSPSWVDKAGELSISVNTNLEPGTYTANFGTYLYAFPLSHRLDVTVNVGSSSSSSSSSSASCNGTLFIDSVCTQEWQAVSLFEQDKINLEDYKIIKDSLSGKIVTLSTVDSGDVSHGQVLDVKYNSNSTHYGQIGIDTIYTVDGLDMSEYLNGKLMFDVKVISKGDANANLNVKVECSWPCQSNLHEVNVPSLNTWTSIEIPIADMVAEGLNLERISNGFIILPERNIQSNSHFQIDNVRWVK